MRDTTPDPFLSKRPIRSRASGVAVHAPKRNNNVRSVLRKIQTYLTRVCAADKYASPAEIDAVFGNVQKGKRPPQRTMVPTAPDTFVRYAAFGSNANQPWGYAAKCLGCSKRTLDEASMVIAQIFAHQMADEMSARYALDHLSRWLENNSARNIGAEIYPND